VKTNSRIEDAFDRLGHFIADRQWGFIVGVITVAIISCFGFARVYYETDIYALWIERGSRLLPERRFVEEKFGNLDYR